MPQIISKRRYFGLPGYILLLTYTSLCLLGMIICWTTIAGAVDGIQWGSDPIQVELKPEQKISLTATFRFDGPKPVKKLRVVVSKPLRPFVKLAPRKIKKAVPGFDYNIDMTFLVPPDTDPGEISGQLNVYSWVKSAVQKKWAAAQIKWAAAKKEWTASKRKWAAAKKSGLGSAPDY